MYVSAEDVIQERVKYVLRKHKSKLEADMYGRIVPYNCGVKQHVEKMDKMEEQMVKKRKLFEEIICDEPPSSTTVAAVVPKKKKKDDRATKYRKQLESLGISYNEEKTLPVTDTSNTDIPNTNNIKDEEEMDYVTKSEPSDDLTDVLHAI